MTLFSTLPTIAAIATPSGRGGVGIIRISGEKTKEIALNLLGKIPKARYALLAAFKDANNLPIDTGIALYFEKPHSFTGEDVLELQGHGGPAVMDRLLHRVLSLGARVANPGEFSLRAFLNDKIDLTQAEAIADLINANTHEAAKSAVRSLQGEFSERIYEILEKMIQLRVRVEAAIDFPEEEIDFLSDQQITNALNALIQLVENNIVCAKQGVLLQEGIHIVIAGVPNVGKSSLLNRLSGRDSAIVTEVAGTTRDILKETISIDGIPIHIIDTAGFRETDDIVELEGIRRAKKEIEQANLILWLIDATSSFDLNKNFENDLIKDKAIPMIMVINKIDLIDKKAEKVKENDKTIIYLSAKTGEGIELLKSHIKKTVGYDQTEEGHFIARRRHLDALTRTLTHLQESQKHLHQNRAGELMAEELRQAQQTLSEITGNYTPDDLLGEIFSKFCIGK